MFEVIRIGVNVVLFLLIVRIGIEIIWGILEVVIPIVGLVIILIMSFFNKMKKFIKEKLIKIKRKNSKIIGSKEIEKWVK